MSARLPELRLLSPAELLAAAERILRNPTYNVQRVATDEIYTFAVATTQLAAICAAAAAHVAGRASAADLDHLRAQLIQLAAGFAPLPPSPAPPTPAPQEPAHV